MEETEGATAVLAGDVRAGKGCAVTGGGKSPNRESFAIAPQLKKQQQLQFRCRCNDTDRKYTNQSGAEMDAAL